MASSGWAAMTAQRRFVRLQHPWVSPDQDEILIATDAGLPVRLTPPTSWVWQELCTPKTIDQLVERLPMPDPPLDRDPAALLRPHLDALIDLEIVSEIPDRNPEKKDHLNR